MSLVNSHDQVQKEMAQQMWMLVLLREIDPDPPEMAQQMWMLVVSENSRLLQNCAHRRKKGART